MTTSPSFRIYYGDGSTYDGPPQDAPPDNVQCIAWSDPDLGEANIGRAVLRDWDIYIYSDGIGWHGTNKWADLRRHLSLRPCKVRAVCFGEWIPRERFAEILARAENDPDFRAKSARWPAFEEGSLG